MSSSLVHRKILIVEDDPELSAILREPFLIEEYGVAVADSIESALSLAREQRPSFILADFHLKDGLATDLLVQLKQKEPVHTCLFFVMTGYPFSELSGLENPDIQLVLEKPFDLRSVLEFMERVEQNSGLKLRRSRRYLLRGQIMISKSEECISLITRSVSDGGFGCVGPIVADPGEEWEFDFVWAAPTQGRVVGKARLC